VILRGGEAQRAPV